VSIRAKLLLVLVVLGIAPMLLLSICFYRSGVRAVEQLRRDDVTSRAADVGAELKKQLTDREADLNDLARNLALRNYLRAQQTALAQVASHSAPAAPVALPPNDVQAALELVLQSFVRRHPHYFASVTLVGAGGRPLVRADSPRGANGPVMFAHLNELPDQIELDGRVW
jgi:hypothetical protein